MTEIELKAPMTMAELEELCVKARKHNVRIVVDIDSMAITVEPLKRNESPSVHIDTIRHP